MSGSGKVEQGESRTQEQTWGVILGSPGILTTSREQGKLKIIKGRERVTIRKDIPFLLPRMEG